MQEGFFKEHKKLCISAGILILILVGTYLYFMFRPGLWFKETFLYRQSEGVYAGSDSYANYELCITRNGNEVEIDFSVDDTTKKYRILSDKNHADIQIYEEGEVIFRGSGVPQGEDYYLLIDKKGEWADDLEYTVVNGEAVYGNDLFPNNGRLYTWAVTKKDDRRGNPHMLIMILLFVGLLAVDIRFPNFFFFLDHGLSVDGGEPSDWYRFWQKVGRGIDVLVILGCVIFSFAAP